MTGPGEPRGSRRGFAGFAYGADELAVVVVVVAVERETKSRYWRRGSVWRRKEECCCDDVDVDAVDD